MDEDNESDESKRETIVRRTIGGKVVAMVPQNSIIDDKQLHERSTMLEQIDTMKSDDTLIDRLKSDVFLALDDMGKRMKAAEESSKKQERDLFNM